MSGGLFSDVQVNEAMLFAPVLLLTGVALLFMRLFPMFVRYISGETPDVVHVIASASAVILIAALMYSGIQRGFGFDWVVTAVALLALVAAYWMTLRTVSTRLVITWLVLQTALVALFVWQNPVWYAIL